MAERDLQARLALVTGGTNGVGKEIARRLSELGFDVIVVGRDDERGHRTVLELSAVGPGSVEFIQADLSLVSEADRLSQKIRDRNRILHWLIHCAGVVQGTRQLTAEGIEMNFAVNFLTRLVLTTNLLPLLQAPDGDAQGRGILLISGAARGKINYDDVNLSRNFGVVRAVRQFCQANDLLALALSEELGSPRVHPRVNVGCLKLGVVKTDIRRTFPRWMKILVPLVFDPLFGQTLGQAAESAIAVMDTISAQRGGGPLFMKIRRLRPLGTTFTAESIEAWTRLSALSGKLASSARARPVLPGIEARQVTASKTARDADSPIEPV
jgi:NAD(P)-dependent dehydrogenase (short-subunit alcohol dehydrogenase family)